MLAQTNSLYPFASSPAEVVPLVFAIFTAHHPDAVITHGSDGEYGHPAHVLANRACLEAARRADVPCVYTFGADFPGHPRKRSANRDDPADFVVAVDRTFEQKLSAMECHRTQGALFVRRASADAGHPVPLREVVLRVESFRRVAAGRAMGTGDPEMLSLLGDAIRPE